MPSSNTWFRLPDSVRWLSQKLALRNEPIHYGQAIEFIRGGVEFSGINFRILMIAIFMASLGLNVNSTAVIIGAMLISPLMGPIVGIGLALGIYDIRLLRVSLRNLFAAVLVSLAVSCLYFLISPLKDAGSELLARTSPSIYDVLIAFAGGLAGIFAASSRHLQGNVIPGVAIATALMPPLCTVGFNLARGNWADMFGALYLFIINSVFISLATYVVVRLLHYPPVSYVDKPYQKRIRTLISTLTLLVLAPSIFLTYKVVDRYVQGQRVTRFLKEEFPFSQNHILRKELSFRGDHPKLSLTILGRSLDSTELATMQLRMQDYHLSHWRLEVVQGVSESAIRQGYQNEMAQAIQGNSSALSEAFQRIDSLQEALKPMMQDTALLSALSREGRKQLPGLKGMQVTQTPLYRSDSSRFDTLHTVKIFLSTGMNSREEASFKDWLRLRTGWNWLVLEKTSLPNP